MPGASPSDSPVSFSDGRPRWTLFSVVISITATLGIFLLLPSLEGMAPPEAPELERQALQRAVVPPPQKPPPPPEKMEPLDPVVQTELPRPDMPVESMESPPLRIPVDLKATVGKVPGPRTVDFAVRGEGLAGGMARPVFEIAELDRAPQPLARVRPMYPPRARARRQEGYAVVVFVVNEQGKVDEVNVVESVPAGLFGPPVARAVRSWRFEPGRKGGEPVPVRVRQRIDFTLE